MGLAPPVGAIMLRAESAGSTGRIGVRVVLRSRPVGINFLVFVVPKRNGVVFLLATVSTIEGFQLSNPIKVARLNLVILVPPIEDFLVVLRHGCCRVGEGV